MTRIQSVVSSEAALMGAVKEGNWGAVDTASKRLSTILLESFSEHSSKEIESIKSALAEAFARIVLLHDVDLKPSAERAAWSLNSVAMIAEAAASLVTVFEPTDRAAASDRILQLLAQSNVGRLTNKDLADQCDLAEETVARALPKLIAQNKIRSWRAGRARLSEITQYGREYLRNSRVSNSLDYTWPISTDHDFVFQSDSGRPQVKQYQQNIDDKGTQPIKLSRAAQKNDNVLDHLLSEGDEYISDIERKDFLTPVYRGSKEFWIKTTLPQNIKPYGWKQK